MKIKKRKELHREARHFFYRNRINLVMIAVVFCLAAGTHWGDLLLFPAGLPQAIFTGGKNGTVPPAVSAESAIVLDAEDGRVLYEKNPDAAAYPASTTKIMTTMLAIETLESLQSPPEQEISVPKETVGIEGSSIYLAAGEKVRMMDLLYGAMLRSGNDAAETLAVIIGGDREHFITMMNERAAEIGCRNTHFTNPSGLFDKEHYTTARDMALISREAMKNELFREIAASPSYTASRAPERYNYFYNKNKTVHQYEGGNGIKIGYTKTSGRTLAASAKREDRQLICVVMNAPDWFQDAYALMDYCFDNK